MNSAVVNEPRFFRSNNFSNTFTFFKIFPGGTITGFDSDPKAFCNTLLPKIGIRNGLKGLPNLGNIGNVRGSNGNGGKIGGNKGGIKGNLGRRGKSGGGRRGGNNGGNRGGSKGGNNNGGNKDLGILRDLGDLNFFSKSLNGGGFGGSFRTAELIFINIGECLDIFLMRRGLE